MQSAMKQSALLSANIIPIRWDNISQTHHETPVTREVPRGEQRIGMHPGGTQRHRRTVHCGQARARI